MTRFVEGCDRGQSTLFPAVLDRGTLGGWTVAERDDSRSEGVDQDAPRPALIACKPNPGVTPHPRRSAIGLAVPESFLIRADRVIE